MVAVIPGQRSQSNFIFDDQMKKCLGSILIAAAIGIVTATHGTVKEKQAGYLIIEATIQKYRLQMLTIIE